MGHVINGTVSIAHVHNVTEDNPAYADIRIRTNLTLPLTTAEQIAWAILAEHSGIETLILRGLLSAGAHVYEIKPSWQRGWPEYIVSFRASHAAPVNIEPLMKGTP
jgi:hypothetical protein